MAELEGTRGSTGATTSTDTGEGASPGKRLAIGSTGGGRSSGPLDGATRSTMESGFATDFSGVNIHPDSPQASGSTHAFTQGSDVHFAPGRYQPGTSQGNWLIAHELAHVVQQSGASPSTQRFDPTAPSLAHEADADRAADAVMAGGTAQVSTSTRAGGRQAYEAWEHRALGDSGGGAQRTITVDCGITLTYGQVVALSGDFYRSPEALMHAPRAELEHILATMNRERSETGATDENEFGTHAPTQDQINQNNADYELASTGPGTRAQHHDDDANPFMDDEDHAGGPDADHPHGTVTPGGGHTEDNGPQGGAAPSAEDSFLSLADNNASHFSPENINLNFKPKHQLAIDLAKEAWQVRHPGQTPGSPAPSPTPPGGGSASPAPAGGGSAPAPATGGSAPATGGSTPAAAPPSGGAVPVGAATPTAQTVSTSSTDAGERKEAMAYLSDGFAVHFLTDAFASGHLISGSVGRQIGARFHSAHVGQITAALTACYVRDFPAAALAMPEAIPTVIGAMSGLIAYKAGSLTLKLVHDYFNSHGVKVKNPLGTEWTTVGDANLSSSPITQQQGSLAAQASREGVEKCVREGTLSDDDRDKPLQYVPSEAQFADGPYQTIAAFCADETIFDAVLSATMLSPDPAQNKLWQLVKGNVGPMVMLKLRQAGRWIGDLATGAYQAAAGAARTAGRAIVNGAQTAGRAIANGAEAAGNAIVRGAEATGNAIVSAGNAVVGGAQAAGRSIARGAEAAGNGVVAGGRAAIGWVSSLFD